ncbi:MAG: hypothetical protein IJY25_05475 [Bacilli bacterium]|nr:hypothetical protein [Bacilli bacterium]
MSKEKYYIRLRHNDGQDYYVVNGKEKSYNPNELVQILSAGIKNRTVKFGKRLDDGEVTRYVFEVDGYDEAKDDFYKGKFSIKVLNKEKQYIKCIQSIEALTTAHSEIKKTNRTRLAAGILIGVTVLTMASPAIAKGINKLLQKEEEYNDYTYSQHQELLDSLPHNITFEEQITAQKEYYKDLSERAKEGDQDAIDELTQYQWGQQRLEEIKAGEKENGFTR